MPKSENKSISANKVQRIKFNIVHIDHHKTYMYINFQQNRANRSVITVHANVFAQKIANCINLQLPIAIFKNRSFQTCLIEKRSLHVYQFSAKSG